MKTFAANTRLTNGLNALMTRTVQITSATKERREGWKGSPSNTKTRGKRLQERKEKWSLCYWAKHWDSSPEWRKVINFECNFIEDVIESDDKFESDNGKNDPEVFMLNQHKIKSTLGHPEVIVGIPVRPGSHKIIALCGLIWQLFNWDYHLPNSPEAHKLWNRRKRREWEEDSSRSNADKQMPKNWKGYASQHHS